MTKTTYHIIGAGIAGLTTAKYLKKYHPDAKIILYEAAQNCGGKFKSYFDKKLDAKVDIATHAVLKCNSEALKIIGNVPFQKSVLFYDVLSQKFSCNLFSNFKLLALSLFNLPFHLVASGILKKTLYQMFPFYKSHYFYFSENLTNEKYINPYIQFLDEIHFNYVLKDVQGKDGRATKLCFNKKIISLEPNDMVISALDIHNFAKIFKTKEPQYSKIINIHYRTSTPLTLPQSKSCLAVKNALAHWIFVNNNILSVTISHAENINLSKDELAREVWKEICLIRKVKAPFVPPYRVLQYPYATLRHDDKNNLIRPKNCTTQFQNFFLAGDWTMRDWPCCLEAAAQSGKRAAKTAYRMQKKLSKMQ